MCDMRSSGRSLGRLLFIVAVAMIGAGISLQPLLLPGSAATRSPQAPAGETVKLASVRGSALDLEVSGDLASLEPGSTRYVTREQLLAMPQSAFTVTQDANFSDPTEIKGVTLSELARQLASAPDSDLIVAICVDQYHAHYTRTYVTTHHPVLVLKINGKEPAEWPKDAEGHGADMGPFLISHPDFNSASKVPAQPEDPQIPWGVVKIEFLDEKVVFGAIAPRGPHASDPEVQQGYAIAKQNCFRCHNLGAEGGGKAGRTWLVLSAWANSAPDAFLAYVHDPKSRNTDSQMPANPQFDALTLKAITDYFQTFSLEEKK
jgi:mono/diheme cytochrome c family protein